MTNVARAATESSGFLSVKSGDKVSVGFGGGQVEVMVDRAARAFRTGQLKRVIAICGQDFASDAPDYFERLFAALPDTSVALTCGDVKFRFTIGQTSQTSYNVPKVIDVGRERDANAALRFASELDAELDRDVADLLLCLALGRSVDGVRAGARLAGAQSRRRSVRARMLVAGTHGDYEGSVRHNGRDRPDRRPCRLTRRRYACSGFVNVDLLVWSVDVFSSFSSLATLRSETRDRWKSLLRKLC